MDKFSNKYDLIKEYYKAIIDIRQKVEGKDLILCFGAGISKPWHIPNWKELVKHIAGNNEVKGENILKSNISLSSKVQALYEKFRKKQQKLLCNSKYMFLEDHIQYKWVEIIRHELYKNHKHDELKHPYIGEYLRIIEEAPVTINYNFDNLIEQCIIQKNKRIDKWGKNIETVDKPYVNLKRTGVIIHPNGFLPESIADSISDHFVFSEKSFQDQLMESIMGYYNPIMYFFSRYTTLFIGLSITDPTLMHLLRQNAVINPGHFNYYIYFKSSNFNLTEKEMKAIQESYFDTFNLIVLFMDNSDINCLGKLLNLPLREFKDLFSGLNLNTVCNYYISGAPGTGKTSTLNMLKNYNVYSEFDERNEDLYEDDANLSNEKIDKLNQWIAKQFRYRNREIEETKLGIQLIDRTPLDPITYAKDVAIHANNLKNEYKRTNSDLDLVSGQIILLQAEMHVVYRRLHKRRPNKYSKTWCNTRLDNFYKLFDKKDITIIDTSYKSISEITKEIARLIYFEDYNPINLNNYLEDFCKGKRDFAVSIEKNKAN